MKKINFIKINALFLILIFLLTNNLSAQAFYIIDNNSDFFYSSGEENTSITNNFRIKPPRRVDNYSYSYTFSAPPARNINRSVVTEEIFTNNWYIPISAQPTRFKPDIQPIRSDYVQPFKPDIQPVRFDYVQPTGFNWWTGQFSAPPAVNYGIYNYYSKPKECPVNTYINLRKCSCPYGTYFVQAKWDLEGYCVVDYSDRLK